MTEDIRTENTEPKITQTGNNEKHGAARLCRSAAFKHALSAVVFVALFILMLTTLTYMLRTSGDVKDRFEGFYAEPDDSLDVVLIGSSPTYSSCSTPMLYGEYGIKAYPLASNVQRPSAGLYLVKEAEKTQSPDLYMFEMRMYSSLEVGLVSNIAYTRGVTDNMKYSFNRIAAINALIPEVSERYTYYFDIFKYHSNWTSLRLKSQLLSFDYTKKDLNKGSLITDKVGPTEMPASVTSDSSEQIDAPQEEALRNLIAYLKDNDLNALFYLSPYKMEETDPAKYNYIRDIIEEAGYEFLDMNQYYDEIGIDFSGDFSDYGVHTNAVGEQKCTRFLGEYLKDNYDLTDHRDIETDSSWPEAYSKWQSDYEDASQTISERIANEDWNIIEE